MASNEVALSKWACLCGVLRACVETAAVTHGSNPVTTKQPCTYTTSVAIQNSLRKASHSFTIVSSAVAFRTLSL